MEERKRDHITYIAGQKAPVGPNCQEDVRVNVSPSSHELGVENTSIWNELGILP